MGSVVVIVTFNVGRAVSDGREDVDEDQEQGDEEGHPAGHDLRGDQETGLKKRKELKWFEKS